MDSEKRKAIIACLTENLPALRRQMNISQEELCARIGVSRSTLSGIESKKRELSWKTCLALLMVCVSDEKSKKVVEALGLTGKDLQAAIKEF